MIDRVEERSVRFFTEDHFRFFIERCDYYVSLFQLNFWDITYFFEDYGYRDEKNKQDIKEIGASCQAWPENSTANIALNKRCLLEESQCYEDSIRVHIEKYAFHEVVHLVLSDYTNLAENRFISLDQLNQAEERFVRIMENCILPKISEIIPGNGYRSGIIDRGDDHGTEEPNNR